jgi:hypothetical protein
MKKSMSKLMMQGIFIFVILLSACEKSYLDRSPIGSISETTLADKAGVNGLLIGAYSLLDKGGWPTGMWIFGGVSSDDAHTGTEAGALQPIPSFENYSLDATVYPLNSKWIELYAGVQRANDVLRVLAKVPSDDISSDEATQIKAEALFLRALYHFQAAMLWRNVPYVDETVDFASNNYNVPNKEPIWPEIEKDFQFAADNLTPTKPDAGRANSWAAKAFLVKVYMFEHKYAEAQPLLADIISNGVTANGKKYALCDMYEDNFDPAKKNNSESVFAVQMSVNDGAGGANGNTANGIGFSGPFGGPFPTYGFYQPSFSLVNSFKTDPATGLPLIYTWNESDIKNDQGMLSSEPFTPYTGTVDSRLDWTVGRRGIPYLDWGVNPGQSWVRQQSVAGPYLNVKGSCPQSEASEYMENYSKGVNDVLIRFAQVLLWAAEVEVEIGSLSKAEMYVNQVRARAANPEGWVHTYIDPNDPLKGFTDIPAANYKVGLYPAGYFELKGKDFARDAVRFEEKIELAMEGHRFFELQRYDNGSGYMADVLNDYVAHETHIPGYNFDYMIGAKFTKGKNEIFPIPQAQIDLSTTKDGATLTQNPGY